ncbi:MAG: hypothetical protein ACK41F_02455 [Fimbriimonadaceae bacterium]
MIASWALLVLGNGLPVVELAAPEQKAVCAAVVVRVPELSPKGVAAARALAEAFREGSGAYGRQRWVGEGALVGVVPKVELTEDALLVRLASAPGRHKVVASLLADLLRSPMLSSEAVGRAIVRAKEGRRSFWERAVDPRAADWAALTPRDVVSFAAWLLQPDRVAVAIGGPFQPGEGRRALEVRLDDWRARVRPAEPPGLVGPGRADPPVGPPRAFRWTARWTDLSDRGMGTLWLVASALGAGKGGSLFRTWRIEDGFSYRQECRVEGTPSGVALRILLAKAHGLEAVPEGWRRLRTAVEAWTEQDRLRALAVMERQGPVPHRDGALALTGFDPTLIEPFDQAALAAYWAMKTGRPLSVDAWLAEARATPLEEMKALALGLLTEAQLEGSSGSSNSG